MSSRQEVWIIGPKGGTNDRTVPLSLSKCCSANCVFVYKKKNTEIFAILDHMKLNIKQGLDQ